MADALLHSSAVYFYAYDPQTRAYAQQTDSVVGCALLASSTPTDDDGPFKLLFYNSQKQPLLQLSVTASTPKCTPQQDNYVNFLDDATQKFYSMRFKDAAGVSAFLSAVAFVKAQQLAMTSASFAVLVDDLALGKEDGKGHGLAVGDVAGIALTVWQGQGTSDFFTENPLDIAKQQAAEVIERDGDVKRVRLVEKKDNASGGDDDPLGKALATEALAGMQKNAKRLVTVVVPQTQQWFIASVELVKVKKATRSSATTTTNSSSSSSASAPAPAAQEAAQQQQQMTADGALAASANDELIQRMANLSRAGSKGSGLIASLSSRAVMNGQSPELGAAAGGDSRSSSRKTSFAELQAAVAQKFVPVLMPGMQLPDGKKSPTTSTQQENGIPQQQQQQRTSHPESLAAKVIAPLKDPSRASSIGNLDYAFSPATTIGASTSSTSSEMDRLIQEQSDLAQLRKQLEESKRKLQEGDNDDVGKQTSSSVAAGGRGSAFGADQSRTSSGLNGFGQWQSSTALPSSSLSALTSSSFTASNPAIGASSSNPYGNNASPSRWSPSPSSLDLVPSFQPSSSFLSAPPPPFQPTPASAFNPSSLSSSSSYNSRSLVTTTPGFSSQTPGASMEVENGILRLQRSSTSIESSLQDIQSKIDRLLNSQNSLKTSKYTPSASSSSLYGSSGLSSSSGPSPSSSSSSSSILLKNLEKALTQRDQLQELNGRLQESREQMESTIEDLQNQHEALQMENRNLLDKLQNGNHLQQEKFRLELRNVQQQLGHTQEQMLVYQEENFRLRSELAAKDDQLLKEKAQLQDDARKQLESLQRQLEAQVRQDSKDSIDKVLKEKSLLESQVKELAAQKQQWEQERDAMTNQLRLAQSQIQDERSRSQSAQDTRVQELQVQLQQMGNETRGLSQQVESLRSENRELEELLAAKEHEVEMLQESKSSQEYAALSELLKEFMNDIYFHFQDAFDEDTEFTGKEIVMAIRKILKQNTMDILTKLEEFWQLQAQNKSRNMQVQDGKTRLVIGNTMFVTLWLNMYELEVLKNRKSFIEYLRLGLAQIREHCQSSKWVHSSKLRHLLFEMLSEKPQERLSIHQMLDHPWFHNGSSGAGAGPGTDHLHHRHSRSGVSSPSSPGSGSVLVRHVSQLEETTGSPSLSPSSAVAPLSNRSLTKVKSHSTSSASSLSPFIMGGSASGSLRINPVVRPLSAEGSESSTASHSSSSGGTLLSPRAPKASSTVAVVKVSLPSLSPEKPSVNCSPEKVFAKRSNSLHYHHSSE